MRPRFPHSTVLHYCSLGQMNATLGLDDVYALYDAETSQFLIQLFPAVAGGSEALT